MTKLGKVLWDDPAYAQATIEPRNQAEDLGSPANPFDNVYANNIVGTTVDLANNTYLQATNAAGNALLNLVKADATDNTFINAGTGKLIKFGFNDVAVATASATVFTPVVNNIVDLGATATRFKNLFLSGNSNITGSETAGSFLLTDGSDKNHNVSTFASGTAYTLTATSAALTFGTSSPTLVLDKAGTYLLIGRAHTEFVGATFAANRTVTLKLRRTNNTAADLAGGSTQYGTGVVTTVSGVLQDISLPAIFYTTTNTNDIVTVFGDVSVVPTAGSLVVSESSILAIRLF